MKGKSYFVAWKLGGLVKKVSARIAGYFHVRFYCDLLGKGSKIKLIIFAEFSAKGVPPPPFAENN